MGRSEIAQSYWYLTIVWWCPDCGSENRVRERQYTPKPTDTNQTQEWIQTWDGCNAL